MLFWLRYLNSWNADVRLTGFAAGGSCFGTRGGVRFAQVHRALLLELPQLNPIR